MKYFLWFIRIVVGVLFIFSGLVKANDPLGLTYKMNEFFEAMNMVFMTPFSFAFSIFMIAFEITCGVAVLLGWGFRVFSILLLLLNIFFTFLTGYALFTGKVKECGCFGECIKISSTDTFYKDVALLVLSVVLVAYRGRIKPLFARYTGTALMILCVVLAFGIQWWALEHLPFVDCLAYKAGNNLWQKMQIPPGAVPDKYESILIYEKNGQKKEFTMDNYPWQDTTWKFVDRKDKLIQKGNAEPEIRDFVITDYDGNDHTQEILTMKGYVFLLFVKDANEAREDNMEKIHALAMQAEKLNIPFYVLCSSTKIDAMSFQQKWKLNDIPFYELDGTVSKTAMRSNPGLMLLDNGTVQHKWSFRDYPENLTINNGQLIYK